jgi:hypothetical protein
MYRRNLPLVLFPADVVAAVAAARASKRTSLITLPQATKSGNGGMILEKTSKQKSVHIASINLKTSLNVGIGKK